MLRPHDQLKFPSRYYRHKTSRIHTQISKIQSHLTIQTGNTNFMKKNARKENTPYGLSIDTLSISARKKMAAVLRNEDLSFHISSFKCESQMAMKLVFQSAKKESNKMSAIANLHVFSVIFSSLCQLDPFLIIPHFPKMKKFKKWIVTFIFSNWQIVSLDYLLVNGM